MKKILAGIFLFVFVLSAQAQLPDLEVRDLERNWVALQELKGEKLTVVDFWATWCKPCVAAIPKLNTIAEEFSDKGVNFIGINVDGPRNQAKVKPFVKTLNINYTIILDPNQELVNELNVSAYPTLLVYNDKGKEVFVHEGFNPGDEKLIKKELEKLLEP